jgi:DNA-binding NarL/FixJ family response regulator
MRVAIVDDQALFRTAVAAFLEHEGMEVVVNVATGAELIAGMAEHPVDIAVVDVRLAGSEPDGVEVARAVKRRFPGVAILILSAYTATAQAIELISSFERSIGYLRKDELDIDDLGAQLTRLVQGDQVLGRSFVAGLMRPRRSDSALQSLTAPEREVLGLMAEGYSNAGIARVVGVAERTVEDRVRQVFTKLDITAEVHDRGTAVPANKRVLAVLRWLRAGTAG